MSMVPQSENSQTIRVLFVDDEPFILNALKRLFRKEGYDIHTATSGAEALEILRQSRDFALIMSDQKMPNMVGVEFLSQSKPLMPKAKRVILSAYSEAEHIQEALNIGLIDCFIEKPWVDHQLRERIKSLLALQ